MASSKAPRVVKVINVFDCLTIKAQLWRMTSPMGVAIDGGAVDIDILVSLGQLPRGGQGFVGSAHQQ